MDLKMSFGRLHVLTKSEAVHSHPAQVLHGGPHLLVRLAKAEHDGRLRHQARHRLLSLAQHLQGLPVLRSWVPHSWCQPLHSLNIVGKYIEAAGSHSLYTFLTSRKVW